MTDTNLISEIIHMLQCHNPQLWVELTRNYPKRLFMHDDSESVSAQSPKPITVWWKWSMRDRINCASDGNSLRSLYGYSITSVVQFMNDHDIVFELREWIPSKPKTCPECGQVVNHG